MSTSGPQVSLDLSRPPRVRQAGVGVHGTARRVEKYRLRDLWSVHLYSYRATLEMLGQPIRIEPGMVTLTPADTPVVYHLRGPSENLYAHFALPPTKQRADPDTDAGASRTAAAHRLGRDGAAYRQRLERVVELQSVRPRHAEAVLWAVLWDLVARPTGPAPGNETRSETQPGSADTWPAALTAAVGYIDTRLHEPIRVRDLADHVGYSHNHLTRLFRRHLGTTVIAFLRARRMQRARHLLTHSDRTVGDIGTDVGLPDPQQFNKTFRQFYGRSPTAFREAGK